MQKLVEMNWGSGQILIEATDPSSAAGESTYRGEIKNVVTRIDKALDEMIQNQVVSLCASLCSTFEKLKQQPVPPKKVSSEFGLQLNAEGNLYITKIVSESSFKISIEWEFKEE